MELNLIPTDLFFTIVQKMGAREYSFLRNDFDFIISIKNNLSNDNEEEENLKICILF
jgi:hypothetical protein